MFAEYRQNCLSPEFLFWPSPPPPPLLPSNVSVFGDRAWEEVTKVK